ncbi:hypothetical protein [Sinorhizobium meliloti]|uniref:hypothetical protein n=1 Tax=Rhizobium meliloti TaxID=382 RepID=UPI0013E39107|nr:hypothetical protein [Sinorhizobium meliloti]
MVLRHNQRPRRLSVIVLAMQTADILCQGPLPGDRHRQEQHVEPGIIEAFADIAARRKDQALSVVRDIQAALACLRSFADMPPRSTRDFSPTLMPGPGDHSIFVRLPAYSGIESNGE